MVRKIPTPMMMPETAAYWQAANERRLLVKYCRTCGLAHHYPRDICPHCMSADTEWRESSGEGTIYAFSTMGQGEDAYTIAFVTLKEGVTIMSNLDLSSTDPPTIGASVHVVFQPSANGQSVPMFQVKA